jgi:hypothetical protein
MKKLIALIATGAFALFPHGVGAAAQHGFTCTISGSAKFKPGLTMDAQELKFSFKGELTGCESTSGSASGATVTAKGVVNEASCLSGQGEGIAKTKWDDGSTSTLEFSTEDVTAGVFLTGTVGKSNSDTAQSGADVAALLAFDADATRCNSGDGITDAEFSGQAFGGSPS